MFGAQFGGATLAFLWPNLEGGFGSLIVRRQHRRHQGGDPGDRRPGLQRHRSLLHRAVRRHSPRRTPTTTRSARSADGHHAAVPAVRAPRVPRAVLPHLEVVRVPLPRLQVQRRRRVPARPGADAAWSGSRSRSTATASSWSTRPSVILGAAPRHRHDQRTAAGSVLRGPGLGET